MSLQSWMTDTFRHLRQQLAPDCVAPSDAIQLALDEPPDVAALLELEQIGLFNGFEFGAASANVKTLSLMVWPSQSSNR